MAHADQTDEEENGGLPWYVKAMIVLALFVVTFVIVIDVLELAGAV